jgi:CIC family chloride channel protein
MKKESKKRAASLLSSQQFAGADYKDLWLIFYALLVGVLVGVVGSVFRLFLTYIEKIRDGMFTAAGSSGEWVWPVLFAVVCIGIALFLTRIFAPEAAGSGIHQIEGALDGRRPMRWQRVLPVKFIASLFSLGSGLLLGREGPTIQIGANIGKMTNDVFSRANNNVNPLVSAGAAAGLASAFNAPLSGIIFVIEEMHGHFKYNFYSVAAIMVAAGTADIVVRALVGADPVLKITVFPGPPLAGIWLFMILGVLFAFIGLLFNRLLVAALDLVGKWSAKGVVIYGVLVGLAVALVGVSFPEMIGGGYDTIRSVLDSSVALQILMMIFVVRMILTIVSYSTGVPGGIFAPLLTLGVAFGMLFGGIAQYYFPLLVAHPGIFAVAGMAAIFASTVRAPLTGLVLAVEMTSNYEAILPLIVVTVTASVVTAQLGNEPIYTTLLKRTLAKEQSKE